MGLTTSASKGLVEVANGRESVGSVKLENMGVAVGRIPT
jgi:hypothetical protein